MPPSPPLVKICGITQPEQAHAIAALGADLLGINFWPRSKRHVPLEKAAWLRELRVPSQVVGVFVNPDLEYLKRAVDLEALSALQLHGDESPEFCLQAASLGLPLIKAFQVKDEAMLGSIAAYPVTDILLDAYHPHERGGLGHTFPWELAVRFMQENPGRRLYLAGGLTPENVAGAVAGVQPYAVDVASGVEDSLPGIKNLAKVEAFIKAARRRA